MQGEKRGIFVRAWGYARRAIGALSSHKYTTIAGALVFFLIMSLVPFTFWLVLLFGKAGLDTDQILELELFGWAKDLLVFFRNNAEGATSGAGLFLLVTTLWSSSAFFYHLRRSGELIYRYDRKKHGWKVRVSAILLTLLILLYFAAAGAVLIGAIYVTRYFSPWLYYPCVYSLVLVFGFFAAWILNAYICPYRCKPSDTVAGSLLTAAGWLTASVAFALYLTFSNKERLYGALALFIVFLLWLYWMMIVFTAGAIYNCRNMRLRGMEHKKY